MWCISTSVQFAKCVYFNSSTTPTTSSEHGIFLQIMIITIRWLRFQKANIFFSLAENDHSDSVFLVWKSNRQQVGSISWTIAGTYLYPSSMLVLSVPIIDISAYLTDMLRLRLNRRWLFSAGGVSGRWCPRCSSAEALLLPAHVARPCGEPGKV